MPKSSGCSSKSNSEFGRRLKGKKTMYLAYSTFALCLLPVVLLVLTEWCQLATARSPLSGPLTSLLPQRKAESLTVTVLYDNCPHEPALETDWGFACLIEGLEQTILFDTGGDGSILLANMDSLHVDPGRVDVVMLSHIHADHTGGLATLLQHNPEVQVLVPSLFPRSLKRSITEAGARHVQMDRGTVICELAFSTGGLGTAIHEQALALKTTHGLVVITGCAHPGVVRMVRQAREIADSPVHLVSGGFHMGDLPDQHIGQVIRKLRQLGVQKVSPCHCSGDRTRQLFEQAYAGDFIKVGVGKKLEFPR